MSKAIPLIILDESTGLFSASSEALSWLRSLGVAKLSTVAIAGTYRTGKSFLLNQLAEGGTFSVGSSVKACTKGIWLYGGARALADGTVCLFLDTEGFGSTSRSETYDVRLFSLALLLSSVFLYNSVGTIDGQAIARLGLVAQLTKHIHTRAQPAGRSEDSGTEFASFFPSFTWIVRDMTVRLEREGRKITAREYLEDALKPEGGLSDEAESKNAIRSMLRAFFPERDCVTLVRPAAEESALQNLGKDEGGDTIRPEFKAGVDALRKKVLASAAARPKALYGKVLTGALFASLVEAYVAALNTGGTPVISSAWDRVVETQGASAVAAGAAAARTVREAASSAAASGVLELEELHDVEAAAERAAFSAFASMVVESASHEGALRLKLREDATLFRASNEAASKAACEAALVPALAKARDILTVSTRKGAGAGAGAVSSNSSSDPDSGEAAALRAALDGAREATPTATSVARAFTDAARSIAVALADSGRGPYRHKALGVALQGQQLSCALADAAASVDEGVSAERVASDALLSATRAVLVTTRGELASAAAAVRSTEMAAETAAAAAAVAAASDLARLRDALSVKEAEVARLAERFDRLSAGLEASGARASEAAAASAADLASARSRIEDLLVARADSLLAVATVSQRLAAAEAARGDSERVAAEASRSLAAEERACALLIERVKTSENETLRLREQTELLYEANRSAKEALVAEKAAKEDIELQLGAQRSHVCWSLLVSSHSHQPPPPVLSPSTPGVSKGKIAQLEADKGALEADCNQLESLAIALKASVGKLKKPLADKMLQRLFDSLP